ncbi:YidC/Oxa1 family membrane protein insertase [Mycetocola reblochoni]|uniref:Membrane protein insertase YidC n=2 Tax=Mycetocola reblochoni TaxID=331618 RepID=A0A1R4IIN1_9MICO|nr:membrane protein insertase YidC [Mycetocola reblochoni]RLP69662.1 membrane protein insertase YidC [Mycetocola reblochoni]SJN19588.1 membrane protein [Mycetocola reblochoni REB411]
MNIYEFGPLAALIDLAHTVITGIAELLEPLAGSASAALAVVLLTLIVRTLLIPVGGAQAKAAAARSRLAPRLAELNAAHKDNRELLARKTMELYQSENTSPTAGCLPVLIQMPVLAAVYGLFILPTVGGHPNDLLGQTLLGIPLGSSLVGGIADGTLSAGRIVVFAAIIVLIAVVAQTSRRLLPITAPAQPAAQPAPGMPAMPDMSGVFRAMSFLPFLTAVIAAFIPLAAGIYLLTTTSWTLVERLVLRRVYPPLAPEPPAEDPSDDGDAGPTPPRRAAD